MQAKPQLDHPQEAPVTQAFDIAWGYVSVTRGFGEDDLVSQAYLAAHILRQYERGEHRALALANRAIAAYQASTDPEGDAARALGLA